MKRIIISILAFAIVLVGCSQNKIDKDNQLSITQDTIVNPQKANISNEQLAKNIADSIKSDFELKQTESNLKALEIVASTNKVIDKINSNQTKEARAEMTKLIGELEILLTKNQNVSLVPLTTGYQVNESVVDVETAKQIIADAKKSMKKGYYQSAKELLDALTSEYVITTTYLPVGTYPDAMKLASAKLDENKTKEAKDILVNALNTLVIDEVKIPLPVLKAEEYVSLAAVEMAGSNKDKKKISEILLDNADYQLKLAEVMGYGKKDKDFKMLADSIKDLKKAIEKDSETKTMFKNLGDKLKSFKERLFYKK
ncbi:MAG TPA: YfdX family protein [Bacteroidetes bacterium]|nr:YfdX family protein [Bacteroidota bacterium]